MFRCLLLAILWVFAASPLAAEEKKGAFDFNGDRFLAGGTIVQDSQGVDDLFMAGETVRSEQPITGSAHLAGRKIISTGAIGGDAYAAGMDVSLEGEVAGDATVAGYTVQVGQVGGDLRISGSDLVISGPVAGYAIIAGDEIKLNSVITGNVSLTAREVEFSEGSRIEGKLTVYEKKVGDIDVPSNVVPEDRLERRDASEWSQVAKDVELWSWRSAVLHFLKWVVIVTAIAALIAAAVPEKLAKLRHGILAQPFTHLLYGFLAQSAVIGSIIILMMTLVGLLLAPAVVLVALVAAFAGYVVAAYALGVGLLQTVGRPEPHSMGTRALAAGTGAFAAGLAALIPFFGWLFVLALALTGVGAIAIWLFRPKFFANT